MATYKPKGRTRAAAPKPPASSPADVGPRKPWTEMFRLKRDILAHLAKHAGTLQTLSQIVAGTGRDQTNRETRYNAIWELTRLEELGKVQDGWIGTGPGRDMAWMLPLPPDER